MLLYSMDDLKSNNLSLDEAVDVAQNLPLWRLMSTPDATNSWRCMLEKKKYLSFCWNVRT